MIFAVLIGFIAAYWVYTDASKLGQERTMVLLWSIATFFMPILFVPLYLLLGRKPNAKRHHDRQIIDVEATVVDDKEKIHCPMCGSKVAEDFKLCPYCGFALKPKCEKCGQELNREWKACPYCQTPTVEK